MNPERSKSPGEASQQAILDLAHSAFGDVEAARHWLSQPNVLLGGVAPSDACRDEAGAKETEKLLRRIRSGEFIA